MSQNKSFADSNQCMQLLKYLINQPSSQPFMDEFSTNKYPDYLEVIKKPMNLNKILVG